MREASDDFRTGRSLGKSDAMKGLCHEHAPAVAFGFHNDRFRTALEEIARERRQDESPCDAAPIAKAALRSALSAGCQSVVSDSK